MSKEKSGATIYYHDIGDYLSREQKLGIIRKARSINGVEWTELHPDEHGDWINHRNGKFATFILLEPDKKFNGNSQSVFCVNSRGFETGRDAWIYNFSTDCVVQKNEQAVQFYNSQVDAFAKIKQINSDVDVKNFINTDSTKISWTSSLMASLSRKEKAKFDKGAIGFALYRPFVKMRAYMGDKMIHRRGQFDEFFPTCDAENLLICTPSIGDNKDFMPIIVDAVPDLHLNATTQCFPLYWYEKTEGNQLSAFDNDSGYIRHDGITDWMLKEVRSRFANTRAITKEHIFYYVYGLLHSPEYRETFSADLKKELPRIPIVESLDDFMAFSKAGKALAALHLHYDDFAAESAASADRNSAASYALVADKRIKYDASQPGARAPQIFFDGLATPVDNIPAAALRIDKMRFATKEDKSQIIYNSHITLKNIPLAAYDYIVNGKSAVEWLLERYQIKTDKDSGILNDPNDWAREHHSPAYILKLLLSVIDLSVKSVGIVKGLPKAGV